MSLTMNRHMIILRLFGSSFNHVLLVLELACFSHVCVHLCACAHAGHRSTANVPQELSTLLIETVFHWDPGLTT